MIIYGFGVVVGFLLVFILFVLMCEWIYVVDVFVFFKGVFIVMIIVGLMFLVFMGFIGLVKL